MAKRVVIPPYMAAGITSIPRKTLIEVNVDRVDDRGYRIEKHNRHLHSEIQVVCVQFDENITAEVARSKLSRRRERRPFCHDRNDRRRTAKSKDWRGENKLGYGNYIVIAP
jgi:hypothetical protein